MPSRNATLARGLTTDGPEGGPGPDIHPSSRLSPVGLQ